LYFIYFFAFTATNRYYAEMKLD